MHLLDCCYCAFSLPKSLLPPRWPFFQLNSFLFVSDLSDNLFFGCSVNYLIGPSIVAIMTGHLNTLAAILIYLVWSCGVCCAVQSDIDCLMSIKDSLEDPLNILKTTWKFDNLTEGFICKFAGIQCWHPDETRVLSISLPDLGLKGKFPRGLKNCTSITSLDLSGNAIHGSIPSDISKIMGYVVILDLSSNNLSGEIPTDLANCSFLNSLKLDHNKFTGRIPAEIGLLPRLKTFNVANNRLTGPVPHFRNATFPAESYANNAGLCGQPLPPCQGSANKSPNTP